MSTTFELWQQELQQTGMWPELPPHQVRTNSFVLFFADDLPVRVTLLAGNDLCLDASLDTIQNFSLAARAMLLEAMLTLNAFGLYEADFAITLGTDDMVVVSRRLPLPGLTLAALLQEMELLSQQAIKIRRYLQVHCGILAAEDFLELSKLI